MWGRVALIAGLLAPLGAASAWAAEASDAWIVTIGGSVIADPNYPGASSYGVSFLPSFSLRRVGEPNPFSAPDDNFGLTLLEFGGIEVGPLAAIRPGRSGGSVPGLPGYSGSFEVGGFAEFWPIDGLIRTRAEALYGLNANDGLTVNLAADVVAKRGPFTFAVGPRMAFADSTVQQTEFGVPVSATLVNPLLTPYTARGGARSAGAAASVAYEWSKEWTVTAYANYDRLLGDAANSPIVRQYGSPDQFLFGLGLEYSFTFAP